jgi:hypothetical protein
MSQGFTVTKGCLAVVLGLFLFFIGGPLLLMGGCGMFLVEAAKQTSAPTPSPTPQPSPTPWGRPKIITSTPRPTPNLPSPAAVTPTPAPSHLPVTLTEHVITTETSLIRLPAGSPFQILTEHADGTVTISSGGTEWTVPRSILP